jgi:hypothetical protein
VRFRAVSDLVIWLLDCLAAEGFAMAQMRREVRGVLHLAAFNLALTGVVLALTCVVFWRV